MPTMTIRYPEELELVIQKLMTVTFQNTKNGAINVAIRNYSNLLNDIQSASDRAHFFECKYNNLLSRVEIFATAQQKLFDFTELK
jgi:hypothetical protein